MSERAITAAKTCDVKKETCGLRQQKVESPRSLSSPADRVLFYQRTIGNRAVQRLIKKGTLQAKLKISQPGDIYEQEADRVAEQVMRMPEITDPVPVSGRAKVTRIQMKCPKCEDELQKQQEEEEKEKLQAKASCRGTELDAEQEGRINSLKSGGQPLPQPVRTFFEPRFGYDFSQVRIHTGEQAAESARAVRARAFTIGQDIVFGAGEYTPDKREGLKLMAHELTHVVQQGAAAGTIGRHVTRVEAPSHASTHRQVSVTRMPEGAMVSRAITQGCIPPSMIPTITPPMASLFGTAAELIITTDYCKLMGCAPFATDYFDNPVGAPAYIAFLAARNPGLSAADIALMAVLSQISLNRPDILTHIPGRTEFYEIKPNSPSGLIEGAAKIGALIGFYGIWSLPYIPGVVYVPTPEIMIASGLVGPYPLEIFLRVQKISPGFIVYDLCARGELAKIGLAVLLAILAIIVLILSRGKVKIPIPLPSPGAPVPVLAAGAAENFGGIPETGEEGASETAPASVA